MSKNWGKLILQFDKWYKNDPHSRNEDYYKETVTKDYLSKLDKEQFIDFFYNFVSDGGKLQSGGHRTKNKFKESITSNFDGYKEFLLKPFDENFDPADWLEKIVNFKYFGKGVATIYLNRINKHKYSIINNKTVDGLVALRFILKNTFQLSKLFKEVKDIQEKLIADYPVLENLYKTDALNHYIIALDEGKELIQEGPQEEEACSFAPVPEYLPSRSDFESAVKFLTIKTKEVSIKEVLDMLEANAQKTGHNLQSNWREIIEQKIGIWAQEDDDELKSLS